MIKKCGWKFVLKKAEPGGGGDLRKVQQFAELSPDFFAEYLLVK